MALSSPKISVASVTPGATFSGYLTKCGGGIKTWHKRWMVLKGDQLYYFKTQKDEDITGSIPVFEWSICKEEPDQKKKNCFSISSQKRTYYIQADTPEQMRQWLQVLNDTIRQRKNPKPTGGTGGGSPMPSPAAPKPTAPPSSNTYGGNSGGSTGGSQNNGAAVANRGPGPNTGGSFPGQNAAPAATPLKPPSQQTGLSGASPRAQLAAAKASVSFLQDDDSKVLEFWQIWYDSIPPREELTPQVYSSSGFGIDFTVSTSANMQKLTWRTGGPQNIFIQKMVDFFWNVGAPESEIDRLNDVGALINPFKIGSWIDMSAKGGMDGGWFFPVEITMKTALEAADAGDALSRVAAWADKHSIDKVYSVGRDMGAAPPRQTEFRIRLPGSEFERQLTTALDAFDMFQFQPLPDDAVRVIRSTGKEGLCLSIVTSSEGFVRLGLLCPRPSTDTVVKLCAIARADNEELAAFEGGLGTDGPAYAEYQYLKEGFGYGVYQEGFDIIFHYVLGEETC